MTSRSVFVGRTRAGVWVTLVAAALLVFGFTPMLAASVGYQDQSFAGAGAPSGQKPESKLWWNDGFWWASMFDTVSQDFHIFKLNQITQTWADTGVLLDERPASLADTLWDGTHLYVASHIYNATPGPGYQSRLYRFSYDPVTDIYSLDSGFPVIINNYRTETLVMDKDSTGKLWATWMQDSTIYINRTNGDDHLWGVPLALPVSGANVDPDDISTVIAFGGNKIGVFWSNQLAGSFFFAIHVDGDPDTVWQPVELPLSGANSADDHMSLKTDSSGRLYALVKTSYGTPGTAPIIMLLERDPASAAWSSYPAWRVTDSATRPIVELDAAQGILHAFVTGPQPPSTILNPSGTIYEKTSPVDGVSFPVGLGSAAILDETTPQINNVTSTKQNLNSSTGLVALATNDSTGRYWHAYEALGTPAPAAPTTDFSATPTSGLVPLTVSFTDLSVGSPTSWAWDFQNDGIIDSTAQDPTFTYAIPGSYTVSLTTTNAFGSNTRTRVNYIKPGALVFGAVGDSYIRSTTPDQNMGTEKELKVRFSTDPTSPANFKSYLKFTIAGLNGPVASAKLRLYVTDPSNDGGSIYPVSNSWTELGITWNNAPPISGPALSSLGKTLTGTWVEFNLGTAITGNGTYSFAIANSSYDHSIFSSREATNAPQLVLGGP